MMKYAKIKYLVAFCVAAQVTAACAASTDAQRVKKGFGVSKDGSEWGRWSQPGCRRDAEFVADYVSLVNKAGGVVALEIKVYNDGSFDPAQLEALKVVGRRTGTLKR